MPQQRHTYTPGGTGEKIDIDEFLEAYEDQASGYGQMPSTIPKDYVYDCLHCGNVFQPSPMTGPFTGSGNMGTSYLGTVVCPRCGGTYTSGPRLAQPLKPVAIYPSNSPGLEIFPRMPEGLFVPIEHLPTPIT